MLAAEPRDEVLNECGDVVQALNTPGVNPAKVRAFRHVLALLISVRAPSVFLVDERASLTEKVNQFTRLMARAGLIDWEFAAELQDAPIEFLPAAPLPPQPSSGKNKAANAVRITTMDLLGITNLYDLNRLHLDVESTIDVRLQQHVTEFLHSLADPEAARANGLLGERLLRNSDPRKVVYAFLLVERTPAGNLVRVHADNLSTPFDFNRSVKLELGSTAKLRALIHYLEVLAELYYELNGLEKARLKDKGLAARDALTRWAIDTLGQHGEISLESFLERAMQRRYAASPLGAFFTGGGVHYFENFEREDNGRVLTVSDGFRHSVNLVFIRLMRDLVSYHRARLAYDADEVLSNSNHPERRRLLDEIAEEESRNVLRRAYQSYQGQAPEEIVNRLLSSEARIDSSRIRIGRLEDSDWRKHSDALGKLSDAPLFIDDTPSISLMEIRAKCRRLKQKHGLDLVIVDYLQLMQSHRRVDSRHQEVAEISRGLKLLAKELDVPVLALSQLSRQPESRTDKRPQLSDLRECVTGDTLVVLADGRRVPIRDLVGTAPEVLAMSPTERIIAAKSERVWRVGVRLVLKVKLVLLCIQSREPK